MWIMKREKSTNIDPRLLDVIIVKSSAIRQYIVMGRLVVPSVGKITSGMHAPIKTHRSAPTAEEATAQHIKAAKNIKRPKTYRIKK